jgi:uncharacterized repeat protein (TIGR01451 family)
MNAASKKITIALFALCALLVPASEASAEAAPAWRFDISPIPTKIDPGATYSQPYRIPQYYLLATNVGTAPTTGPVTITDTLPAGLTLKSARVLGNNRGTCSEEAPTVTCELPGPIRPGEPRVVNIGFEVDRVGTVLQEGDTVFDEAILSGGGAPPARAEETT